MKYTTVDVKISKDSTPEEKTAYSLGVNLGHQVSEMLKRQAELVHEIDEDLVILGLVDCLKNDLALDEMEVNQTLVQLENKFREAMQKLAQEKAKEMAAKAQTNLEAGKKFLEENAKNDGVKVTDSGLQYTHLTEGSGKAPQATDTVEVKYRGTTIDGKVFDEQQVNTIKFPLNGVIKGWTEGLQLMKEGGKTKFFIPANLAYGERGAGADIGPNETLIFEVELVKVH